MRRFNFGGILAIILCFSGMFAASAFAEEYTNQNGYVQAPCDNAVPDGRETVKVQIVAQSGSIDPKDEAVTLSSNGSDIVAYRVAPSIFDTGVIAQYLPVAYSDIKATTGAVLVAKIIEGASCPKDDPVYAPSASFNGIECIEGAASVFVRLNNSKSTDTVGFEIASSTGNVKGYNLKAGQAKEVLFPITTKKPVGVRVSALDAELVSEVFDATDCVSTEPSSTPTPTDTETSSSSPSPIVTVTDSITATPKPSESPSSDLISPTSTSKPAHSTPSSSGSASAELAATGGGPFPIWLAALVGLLIVGLGIVLFVYRRPSPARKH